MWSLIIIFTYGNSNSVIIAAVYINMLTVHAAVPVITYALVIDAGAMAITKCPVLDAALDVTHWLALASDIGKQIE